MLILLLKKHTHPRTRGWFIDHFIQVMYILFLCQNYLCILYILVHTGTHNLSYSVPTIRCQLKAAYVKIRRREAIMNGGKPNGLFCQPKKFPGIMENPQNVPGKCALWTAATWWHRGTSPKQGTRLRLLGSVFPPFNWNPGSGFFLHWARPFRKTWASLKGSI